MSTGWQKTCRNGDRAGGGVDAASDRISVARVMGRVWVCVKVRVWVWIKVKVQGRARVSG